MASIPARLAASKSKVSTILSLFLFVFLLLRSIHFFALPEPEVIAWIADDSFYYQKLACNFAAGGGWSFDGETSTSGFHLLYAYFLSALNWLFGCGSWRISFLVVSFCASAAISISCYLALTVVQRLYGPSSSIAASTAYSSPLVFLQVTSLMESWLSILASSLIFSAAFNGVAMSLASQVSSFSFGDVKRLRPRALYLLALGLFASLSRTDSIVYVAVMASASCILLIGSMSLGRYFEWHLSLALKMLTVLLGAGVGMLGVVAHNYFSSGLFVQSSAATKYFWSSVAGHSPTPFLNLILELVTYPFSSILLVSKYAVSVLLSILLTVCLLRLISSKMAANPFFSPPFICFAIATLVVLSYVAIYSLNSQALQPWYICQILVPISILIGSCWRYAFTGKASFAFSVLLLSLALFQSKRLLTSSPWPHQLGMLNAGRYLAQSTERGKIGSWNSGIMSYFSGKSIVNIDGLVNNEILPNLKAGTLHDYIKRNNISYIVDYEAMLTEKRYPLRGGYGDGSLLRCLEKLRKVDGDAPLWSGTSISIWRVKPNCK